MQSTALISNNLMKSSSLAH